MPGCSKTSKENGMGRVKPGVEGKVQNAGSTTRSVLVMRPQSTLLLPKPIGHGECPGPEDLHTFNAAE
jgi:hypothetical protein